MEAFELEIPPAKSPLLLPATRHLSRSANRPISDLISNFYISSNATTPSTSTFEDQLLDDIDSLGGTSTDWRGQDLEEDEEEESEDELDDFALEDGHIAGIPSSRANIEVRRYETLEFCQAVLNLLRDELQLPGWSNLPCDLPASLLHIHKVSGALTNAVFFASIPECILDVATTIPVISAGIIERATPLSLNGESTSNLTPTGTPRDGEVQLKTETRTIKIAAPTLLLRVYGPSSGSLISRKTELHILHTLSSDYAIGPRVLGTFSNGRVEQYFHSRALVKEELRDARISRWIGRRMRELHRVDLARMIVSDPRNVDPAASKNRSRGGSRERSGIDITSSSRNGSGIGTSIYSTSSGSSIFSFGTSIYSTSSAGSTSSLTTIHDDDANFGTPLTSPRLFPQRGSSESMAALKKRSRSSGVHSSRKLKDSPGVWDMITRWTREAKRVLKELDDLAAQPGFSQLLTRPRSHSVPSPTTASGPGSATPPHSTKAPYVHPLSSPSLTFALRASLNLPLFEQQIKLYRNHVGSWERRHGPSLRVFSHNDTQYGNLLIMAPKEEGTTNGNGGSGVNGSQRMLPHQQIIVVDFEYASANPRGFDIANHFIEWQADYHHPTLSHSLSAHGALPTLSERKRFIRAYIGCDGGIDSTPLPSSSASSIYNSRNQSRSRGGSLDNSPALPPHSVINSGGGRKTRDDSPSLLNLDQFVDKSGRERNSIVLDSPPSVTAIATSPLETVESEDPYGVRSERAENEEEEEEEEEEGEAEEGVGVGDDARVLRLLQEVELWTPASHALWTVWGIVQAKEDILKRIQVWKTAMLTAAEQDDDDKVGDDVEAENEVVTEFDYLSYSAERMGLFREELSKLKGVD